MAVWCEFVPAFQVMSTVHVYSQHMRSTCIQLSFSTCIGCVSGRVSRCVYVPAQGEVVARAGGLDYERQQVHTLTLEARDRASPDNLRLFSTAVVSTLTLCRAL